MAKLTVFNSITIDGYFSGPNGDLSWAYDAPQDAEWREFVSGNAGGGGALLFGRVTYEMMASFWPTPAAAQQMPAVADGMNRAPKFVFSKTLKKAGWQNTTVLSGDLSADVKKLKKQATGDITVLGSGSLVAQLAQAGLVDAYQFVVIPVVLGAGRTMFERVTAKPKLRVTRTRTFGNGNVVWWYDAAK
jgi:dihydrofolate reductase